ncbi:MAG: recombinase family protein [Acidobacteria bacterium]|nr:recombinase family protein [Acidobacteriota bacterium]
MVGKRVGYIRVSSAEQNTSRQLDGVTVDKTFTEHASGKDANRPQLQAALDYLREGDVFVVHSMDRLGRNLSDLRKLVQSLTDKGVKVQFLKENLIFTGEDSPVSNLLLSLLGAVAEFERALILERQREGISIAKRKGKYRGGKPKLSEQQRIAIRERVGHGVPKALVAREFSISRQTLYTALSA